MYYLGITVAVLAIEFGAVGAIAGMFYFYEKVTAGKSKKFLNK